MRKLDEEILETCPVENITQDIQEAEEITSKVYDVRKKIEVVLKKKPKSSVGNNLPLSSPLSTIESSPPKTETVSNAEGTPTYMNPEEITQIPNQPLNSTPPTSSINRPRLPKLTLQKLNGEITKFRGFWESFQSAVHNNPDLTEVDKFNYLYSLLEGPGLRAIQGLTITAENYKSAIDILNERFDKTQQVISAHMDNLLKMPNCTGMDTSQLRSVYDRVSVNVRGLESLGVKAEQYGMLLIPVIMSKLPEDIRMQIARNTSNEVWKIDHLLNLIKHEVEAREVCENVKANDQKTKRGPGDQGRRYASSAAALLAGGSKQHNTGEQGTQCAYCRKSHYSASCEQFRDTDTRKNILKRDGRCFHCLGRGHRARECDPSKKCRKCQGSHHQSICTEQNPNLTESSRTVKPNHDKEDPKKESARPSGQKTQKDHEVTMVNRNAPKNNRSRKILLQTATTLAFNQDGRHSIPVRVLLDSGSQRSYITDNLKERLNLKPIRKETLSLNTFGDERIRTRRCDEVQVELKTRTETM